MSQFLPALLGRGAEKSGRVRSARPWVETLEDRAVPAISLMGGTLTLTGTSGADNFLIRIDPTDPTKVQVSDGSSTQSFALTGTSAVTQIKANGLAGDDVLTIDNGNGLVGSTATGGLGVTFDGGSGSDRLVLSGNPSGTTVSETYNFGSTRGSGSLLVSGGTGAASATVTFGGTEGVTDTLTAASLTINATNNRDVLRLVNGATVGGATTFRLESISEEGAGLLRREDFDDDDRFDDHQSSARGDDNENEDENETEHERAEDFDRGQRGLGAFAVPLTFANKGAVTIDLKGGNDFLLVNASAGAAGVNSVKVVGGAGFDVVAVRGPAGLVTTDNTVERTLTALDQIFIEELYQLRLGRSSDDGGMANWRGILNGRGRRAVLEGILRSPEALGVIVNDLYVKLLNRQADQGGLQNFVGLLQNGGTIEQVITSIATSPEFQGLAAQLPGTASQQEKVITLLYQSLLDRTPSAQELANAVASANARGLVAVVNGIVSSEEFRRLEVASLYRAFFLRDPDEPGLRGWITSRLNLLEIRFGLMESDEFFMHG